MDFVDLWQRPKHRIAAAPHAFTTCNRSCAAKLISFRRSNDPNTALQRSTAVLYADVFASLPSAEMRSIRPGKMVSRSWNGIQPDDNEIGPQRTVDEQLGKMLSGGNARSGAGAAEKTPGVSRFRRQKSSDPRLRANPKCRPARLDICRRRRCRFDTPRWRRQSFVGCLQQIRLRSAVRAATAWPVSCPATGGRPLRMANDSKSAMPI